MCPRAEALPTDLVWKVTTNPTPGKVTSPTQQRRGMDPPLLQTRTKLSKTSSKPWASLSLAGRPRPVDYEWFLARASAASGARLRAQEQLGRKEGTILPAGNRPGELRELRQRRHLSLCTRPRWTEGRWCRLVSPLQWKQNPLIASNHSEV